MSNEKLALHSQHSTSYFIVRDNRIVGRIEWFEDIGADSLIENMKELFKNRETGIPIYKEEK